jgi:hypothetical protein
LSTATPPGRDAGAIASSPELPPGLPWLLRCGPCRGPGTSANRLSASCGRSRQPSSRPIVRS